MDGVMGLVVGRSSLERLDFDNVVLKKLPVDPCTEPGIRSVKGACFSRVVPQPVTKPRFVAVSNEALALLGLKGDEVLSDPLAPGYLSGSKIMPGSEPAAHCYCGHQFGHFAGQLGDGAACYLGEVKVPAHQNPELLQENPSGRWEMQVKGAGLTPFSRSADGRKVLRSSIREFLCSEAMFALGIPTTRAGSVVTSDSRVARDIRYDGHPLNERCSIVLRIAPTFLRFGSFEIFKPPDELTGRHGPSYGRDELRGQMMDYVIGMFYPEIQQDFPDRVERNVAFFREVMQRTARLVAQWQCVGFCHGVLNTDNMSILGLTLDYGPFGFMDRFDPDFICNSSDNSGRYTYQAQPDICRWNLVKLAEALAPELPPERAKAVVAEYGDHYNGLYLGNMRKKLGLLMKEEPEDEVLIRELLQTMHNTGADFSNTFRSLSQIPCPAEGEVEEDIVKQATDLLLVQCAHLEELRAANKPTMDSRELAMLLSMAQSNPALFEMLSDRTTMARQLEKVSKLKELLESSQEDLTSKLAEDWTQWISSYRKRLARELEGQDNIQAVQEERVRVMDSTNPCVVLRNYIAQNAIDAAESGDFSEVRRVLHVLEKPFSTQPGLEEPLWVGGGGFKEQAERVPLPYTSRPPAEANAICVSCSSLLCGGGVVMDGVMGLVVGRSSLERLDFDNVVLKKLPVDPCTEPGIRSVKGACFSRVVPQPVTKPRFVAVSNEALALLGLKGDEVLSDPLAPGYLSGSKIMPGSEPAAHCYCGHQFGHFAGQLGDGAACYLGEVKVPAHQNPELLQENPSGRWEMQVKGAGLTPFSRSADGRKVLRSSIREFLCSEAMFALGIPTTRAGSVVTSDSRVVRDIRYDGHPRNERCSIVLRIAPTFLRFGSFEIFKPPDELTGRHGPSYGRDELRGQMMDYVIGMFYPEIQQDFPDRVERNVAFFREVMQRTARLVAQWQCVGFCHGVLNTDNMSILGLTLDYGPFGFMDRFDPDFICNSSDNSGRYTYQAQPDICRWNLVKLAEALAPELPPERAKAVVAEYGDHYNGFYLGNMRKKLGLLMKEEPEDEVLIRELLQTMHNTGADFSNTFRSLSQIPCPAEGEVEEDIVKQATDLLLVQCAHLEELKAANKPTMDSRELAMLLSMAQSNPALFQMISDRTTMSRQLEKLSKLKELLESSQEDLTSKLAEDWTQWISSYRKRLARELEGQDNIQAVQEERVRVMDSTNPCVVLRNYIAQNAIDAAESGDFSEVRRVLHVLEKPFSSQPGLEEPLWVGGGGGEEQVEREEGQLEEATSTSMRVPLPYTSRPPAEANAICVS